MREAIWIFTIGEEKGWWFICKSRDRHIQVEAIILMMILIHFKIFFFARGCVVVVGSGTDMCVYFMSNEIKLIAIKDKRQARSKWTKSKEMLQPSFILLTSIICICSSRTEHHSNTKKIKKQEYQRDSSLVGVQFKVELEELIFPLQLNILLCCSCSMSISSSISTNNN